ncbi:MAG: ZIP family metal transporter [Caldiserica bacterium]|jgi:zinc and cadmium transporter|nr:ZIP family metal transporter [Caldisericota bacterium]MDH7562409.1 ZIP family metal transporter [Caldisericota bacterium]
MVWAYILIATGVVSLTSLVGAGLLVFGKKKGVLIFGMVNLATGALIGAAFFHLIPESWERTPLSPYFLILGILLFFVLEKFLYWRHCHSGEECQVHVEAYSYLNLIGDAIHNFIDGAVIGGAFIVNPGLGLTTTLAVVLHEVPQELGDFAILLHGGFSPVRALIYNLLSQATCILGGILTFFLGEAISGMEPFLLSFAAGGFLYIALVDLLPEMRHSTGLRSALIEVLLILGGIAMMWGMKGLVAL